MVTATLAIRQECHFIKQASGSTSAPGATIVYRDLSKAWPVRLIARTVSFLGRTIIIEVAQPLLFHYASLREFEKTLSVTFSRSCYCNSRSESSRER